MTKLREMTLADLEIYRDETCAACAWLKRRLRVATDPDERWGLVMSYDAKVATWNLIDAEISRRGA